MSISNNNSLARLLYTSSFFFLHDKDVRSLLAVGSRPRLRMCPLSPQSILSHCVLSHYSTRTFQCFVDTKCSSLHFTRFLVRVWETEKISIESQSKIMLSRLSLLSSFLIRRQARFPFVSSFIRLDSRGIMALLSPLGAFISHYPLCAQQGSLVGVGFRILFRGQFEQKNVFCSWFLAIHSRLTANPH